MIVDTLIKVFVGLVITSIVLGVVFSTVYESTENPRLKKVAGALSTLAGALLVASFATALAAGLFAVVGR